MARHIDEVVLQIATEGDQEAIAKLARVGDAAARTNALLNNPTFMRLAPSNVIGALQTGGDIAPFLQARKNPKNQAAEALANYQLAIAHGDSMGAQYYRRRSQKYVGPAWWDRFTLAEDVAREKSELEGKIGKRTRKILARGQDEDEREEERWYHRQERDEAYAARQQVLDEREREREREKYVDREMKRRAKLSHMEIAERNRQWKEEQKEAKRREKEEKDANKSRGIVARRLAGLTNSLSYLKSLSVGGAIAYAAASAVKSAGTSIAESGKNLVTLQNFMQFRDVDPKPFSQMRTVFARAGIEGADAEKEMSLLGKLSGRLAMAAIGQDNALFTQLGMAGIKIPMESGVMPSTEEMVYAIGNALRESRTNKTRQQQIIGLLGLDENLAYALMQLTPETKGLTRNALEYTATGFDTEKERIIGERYKKWEAEAQSEMMKGGISSVFGWISNLLLKWDKAWGLTRLDLLTFTEPWLDNSDKLKRYRELLGLEEMKGLDTAALSIENTHANGTGKEPSGAVNIALNIPAINITSSSVEDAEGKFSEEFFDEAARRIVDALHYS